MTPKSIKVLCKRCQRSLEAPLANKEGIPLTDIIHLGGYGEILHIPVFGGKSYIKEVTS